MQIRNDSASIWEFVDLIVPEILIAGHWARLCAGKVESGEKETASDGIRSKINATVTDVDYLIQEMVLFRCQQRYENIVPYGEESTKHNKYPRASTREDFFLTVDPLDGTFAYKQGKRDYCTMLCLFDRHQIYLSIIHFPEPGRTYIGIVGEGVFLAITPHARSNPFMVGELDYRKLAVERSRRAVLSTHYRLLKLPYKIFGQELIDQGYEFVTLFGDAEASRMASRLKDSNGSLITDLLEGGSAAYIAPFISYHDLFPLLGLVLAAGGKGIFFDISRELHWDEIDSDAAIDALLNGTRRCRAILSLDRDMARSLVRSLRRKGGFNTAR